MLTTISYTFYAFVFYLSVVKKTPKKVLGFKSTVQSQEYATLNDSTRLKVVAHISFQSKAKSYPQFL
jgi:hypothetical protein